jgi:ABC-2 type transport system ATP-binding protein
MLKATNLTQSYPGITFLDSVSFEGKCSEIFCLLGTIGVGKTTTTNLFLNFIQPYLLQVLIGGKDVEKNRLRLQNF